MENKFLAAGLFLLLAVMVGGYYSVSTRVDSLAGSVATLATTVTAPQFGTVAGTTHYYPEQFLDQIVVSRYGDLDGRLPGVTTTTIPASPTGTTAGQFSWKTVCENNVSDVVVALSATQTLTFPSSTYMMNTATSSVGGCLTKVGDSREFMIYNGATGTITLAISDVSSSLKTTAAPSATANFGNGTSTLMSKDFAKITAVRVTSSTYSPTGTLLTTSPWLNWIVSIYR